MDDVASRTLLLMYCKSNRYLFGSKGERSAVPPYQVWDGRDYYPLCSGCARSRHSRFRISNAAILDHLTGTLPYRPVFHSCREKLGPKSADHLQTAVFSSYHSEIGFFLALFRLPLFDCRLPPDSSWYVPQILPSY